MAEVVRIAMWSGPRNVSTALMRSWGQRRDTVVWDEPLYAYYLRTTRDERHPGYATTVSKHNTDWRKVVETLRSPLPEGKSVSYQKQMAHHLLPDVQREWIDDLINCLLIRDPAHVIASLSELMPNPTIYDTGLPQQVEIFERVTDKTGVPPIVLDSADLLADPKGMLTALCNAIGLQFDDSMLSWPAGLRDSDGAWAPYWYKKVAATTGFGAPTRRHCRVPNRLAPVLSACTPLYDRLHQSRHRWRSQE